VICDYSVNNLNHQSTEPGGVHRSRGAVQQLTPATMWLSLQAEKHDDLLTGRSSQQQHREMVTGEVMHLSDLAALRCSW